MYLINILALTATLLAVAAPTHAQTFPEKPIRFIVPFAPGGSSDIQARIIAQKLVEAWGQPVIVDNRASAGGIVAAEIAARALPDGYTLFLGHVGTQAANPNLYSKLPYDPAADFAAVIQTVSQPLVLVVPPSLKVASVKELIALARREGGRLAYASAGNGSPNHIAGEMFKAMAGVGAVHVPYKGSAPAEIDLMAGRVALFFDTLLSAMPFVKDGRLRALSVTGARRSHALPEAPTMMEAGAAGYDFLTWNGFFAPARTPAQAIRTLNEGIGRALALPDVQKRLAADGADVVGGSPQDFESYVKRERDKLARIIRSAGIRIE